MDRDPFVRSLKPSQIRADEGEDIREELDLYLELRTEELMAEGLSREEARRSAEEAFGDTMRIEADLRRQARRRRAREGTMMTMGAFRQDLGFALRTFRRSPGFTAVAVLTLGLALVNEGGGARTYGHAWAEIHDGRGWVPHDASLPEQRPRVRYVPLDVLAEEGPGYALSLFETMQTRWVKGVEIVE